MLYDDDDDCAVLNKHVDGTDCCLIGIITIGCHNKKYPPNKNTIPYLQISITHYQYRSNPRHVQRM